MTHTCAENRDPIANILGSAYSGNVDLLAVHEKLAKEEGENSDGDAQFRLLLLLHSIDIKLMQSSVQQLSKYIMCNYININILICIVHREVRLSVETVTAELKLLRSVAGIDAKHSLDTIDWESCLMHLLFMIIYNDS
jgi:hypothetical protein